MLKTALRLYWLLKCSIKVKLNFTLLTHSDPDSPPRAQLPKEYSKPRPPRKRIAHPSADVRLAALKARLASMYVVYQTSEPVDFVTSRGSSPRHSDAIPSARDACASPSRGSTRVAAESRTTLSHISAIDLGHISPLRARVRGHRTQRRRRPSRPAAPAEEWLRYSRAMAEIRPRYSWGMAEMRPRLASSAEVRTRCGRDSAETWRRGAPASSAACGPRRSAPSRRRRTSRWRSRWRR